MQFTFLDMAGKTLFIRDDAERAQWTQEEMALDLEFPFIDGKVISNGQRVFFINPSTGTHQVYEIKQAKNNEPDHYQTIVAEHICISELSDEHKDAIEVTDATASNALQQALNGTLWRVGTVGVNPSSSADLSRGSVWQMVLQIKDNWNVYIEPRVVLASDGSITRYLDIKSTDGEWNGLRLSVNKNFLDPAVIFDDSEVATALYGYGGTIESSTPGGENTNVYFTDVVWNAENGHPAKPRGQNYLEDPEATRLYGRNGRARFSYYQNTDITDPVLLLQKTWEALKTCSKPAISIEGTITDLYRLGYADTPIKLHDIALVEVLPAGYKDQIQIIRCTVDLLDPSATTLTIGAYIPNIIYIERKTNEQATGGRGGGGGNKSDETSWQEFKTGIRVLDQGKGMQIYALQRDNEHQKEQIIVQSAKLDVTYNKIETEVTERKNGEIVLSSKIEQKAREIEIEVANKTSAASIVAGINSQTGSYVKIKADSINLTGYTTLQRFNALSGTVDGILAAGTFGANRITSSTINATSTLAASGSFNFKGHSIGSYACTTNGGSTFYALGWG